MPAAIPIAYGVLAATAVAGTAYSISESQQAGKDANRVAGEQRAAQDKLYDDAAKKEKLAADEKAAIEARDSNQARKRSAVGGRKSTILTSPLGVPAGQQAGGKTLLGE